MIDVQEHFYDDDPLMGHPDVRTRLKDVSYFFLGNGRIQAAVQCSPSGEGTPVGLILMNPEHLGKKREALSFDPQIGLEGTMVRLFSVKRVFRLDLESLKAAWEKECVAPTVRVEWRTGTFQVVELFFCPHLRKPEVVREVRVKNVSSRRQSVTIQSGLLQNMAAINIILRPGEEKKLFLRYVLRKSRERVGLEFTSPISISAETLAYWQQVVQASFGSGLLDHYFRTSCWQLPAVIARSGRVDGSIWQYNREWVRDQAMMAVGLTLSGHHSLSGTMLGRLFERFVTREGDSVDSSEHRSTDEVELDQNGVLLYALEQYVWWTGDQEIVWRHWPKIKAAAEFPLRRVFRHSPSGLLFNSREYWERHRLHGIEPGMELAHQVYVSLGLAAAARLARLVSRKTEAARWSRQARRIRHALLYDPLYRLIDHRGFIKRRRLDGSVQEKMHPSAEALLPPEVPLAGCGLHHLNPDVSAALPAAIGIVPPDSPLVALTLTNLERLWNQAWRSGGYGRYHVSSEPDSPGPWPFPSLFIARAYAETGDSQKVWRILKWLDTLPGAASGSWFEFYGPRKAPPFPQVGVTPWTWAEMLILLVHHILGIRPQRSNLRLRPRLLSGLEHVSVSLPLRGRRLHFEMTRTDKNGPCCIRINGRTLPTTEGEVLLSFRSEGLFF